MKELLLKDTSTRHFILESAPLKYSDYSDIVVNKYLIRILEISF